MAHVGSSTFRGQSDVSYFEVGVGALPVCGQMWLMNGHRPNPDTNHHCSTTQQLHPLDLVKWNQMDIYCKKTSMYHSAKAKYCLIKVQTDDKYISNYVQNKNKQIKP